MRDEKVAVLVQKGKIEQYGELVERYEKKLERYLRGLTNSSDEVEDLLQEVFLAGYENIQSFNPDRKFSSWIYRIAHNKAVDSFKKKKEVVTDLSDKEELWQSGEKMIEELEIEKEEGERVRKAITRLELKYREVIVLYFFQEKTYEEIGEVLRVPTGNVGVMLHRAKNKLKKELEVENRK